MSLEVLIEELWRIQNLPGSGSVSSVQSKWAAVMSVYEIHAEPVPILPPGLSVEELDAKSAQLQGAISAKRHRLFRLLRKQAEKILSKAETDFGRIVDEAIRIGGGITRDNRHDRRRKHSDLRGRYQTCADNFRLPAELIGRIHPESSSRLEAIAELQAQAKDELKATLDLLNAASMQWSRSFSSSVALPSTSLTPLAEEPAYPALVLDCGSSSIKAGLAGDDSPRNIVPSLLGYPLKLRDRKHDFFVGNAAQTANGIAHLKYPIQGGVVTDWDNVTKLWHYTFAKELAIALDDPYPVIVTETLWNPPEKREKTIEIMLETFNFPSFWLAPQPLLSLYRAGAITGLVVESGAEVTQIAPIYEGVVISYASNQLTLGGSDVNDSLERLLWGRGCNFTQSADVNSSGSARRGRGRMGTGPFETLRGIKESLAYVPLDVAAETRANREEKVYVLGDGTEVSIGHERFQCAELLFDPPFAQKKGLGIAQAIVAAIGKAPNEIREELYKTIVIGGGNTLLPGFQNRLEADLGRLAPPGTQIHVVTPPEREYAAFTGGSIFGSLAIFPKIAVSREDYKESGAAVVLRRCF